MNQSDFNDEILRDIGGKSKNNLDYFLDNGKLPIGVFLDLSKAFDTLHHTILLNKLLYYGIKGTELVWFKSYLINRTQFVSYTGTNSRTLSITTGVPQF